MHHSSSTRPVISWGLQTEDRTPPALTPRPISDDENFCIVVDASELAIDPGKVDLKRHPATIRFFLNIARWDFDYFGSNKYLYYILSIK